MTYIGIETEDSGALVIDNLDQEIEIIRRKYAREYVEIDDDAPYNRIEIKGSIQFREFESDPIIATFDIPVDNQ